MRHLLHECPDDANAEEWFTKKSRLNGTCRPECGLLDAQTGCEPNAMRMPGQENA